MKRIASIFAMVLCVWLPGCGGGGAGVPSPVNPPSAGTGGSMNASATAAMAAVAADTKNALNGAAMVSPHAQLAEMSAMVEVTMRDQPGLYAYARSVNQPSSGIFRQFLTPQQIADRFGATPSDYAAVQKYFTSYGLAVKGYAHRDAVLVSGTQAAMESAFSTTFATYQRHAWSFYAPRSAPALHGPLPITGVTGLVAHSSKVSFAVPAPGGGGASEGLGAGLTPYQIAGAFDYSSAYARGYTGGGITVAIIGSGAFGPNDVPTYKSIYHVGGGGTVSQVSLTGSGFATAPPVNLAGCDAKRKWNPPACVTEDGETQIDTEQIGGLAPDATVLFYVGYRPASGEIGITGPSSSGSNDNYWGEVKQAISDNRADVISSSVGLCEQDDVGSDFKADGTGIIPTALAEAAAQGIAVFYAAGDQGAQDCLDEGPPYANDLAVDYAGTDINAVAVGAVTTPVGSDGRLTGPLTAWGLQTDAGYASASDGGFSLYFPLSTFQQGASGVTGTKRNVPDVSMEGDPTTSVAVLQYGGTANQQNAPEGGTSVAAPEAAAAWALVLQACAASPACATSPSVKPYRLGNPNAYYYGVYGNRNGNTQTPLAGMTYASTFYDVLFGNNAQLPYCQSVQSPPGCTNQTPLPGFNATNGYDTITGVGVPFVRELIKAVVGV